MNPWTLLTWVGVTALSAVIIAITVLVLWTVIQTIRGKRPTPPKSPTRII